MEKTAVYPGTFDPITFGHIDIIKRASRIFDKLIVSVVDNSNKDLLFNVEERKTFIREGTADIKNVLVESFNTLLTEYVKKFDTFIVIRGLRAVSDFEYEFQLALMNRTLSSEIETIFMMPSQQYTFLSSSIVKEIAVYGGDVKGLVPDIVRDALIDKYKN
jgi:pantetheine-phosphate adenylyltransferase